MNRLMLLQAALWCASGRPLDLAGPLMETEGVKACFAHLQEEKLISSDLTLTARGLAWLGRMADLPLPPTENKASLP